MPKCKKCNKTIPDKSKFCNHCGNPTKETSMYRRADGLYEKKITIDGKRRTFRGKSEKEVLLKIAAYDGEKEKGRFFKDVAEEWEEEHFPTLSPNTLKSYPAAHRRNTERFGEMDITTITPQDVKAYLSWLANRGYAKKTVVNHLLVLNLVFKYAIINQFLKTNPAEYVAVPKGLNKTRREPPTEEQIRIIEENWNTTFGLLAYFVLHTGLRKGEALALTWGDVDIPNKVVTISKSVYFESNKPKFKSPKTESGNRTVILPDVLLEKLKPQKNTEPVFHGKNGFMTETEYLHGWEQHCRAIGIASSRVYVDKLGNARNLIVPLVTLHQLRHEYATRLHSAGVDVKDAQCLMGHSTVAMTQDVYTHVSKKQLQETGNRINKFFSGVTVDPQSGSTSHS